MTDKRLREMAEKVSLEIPGNWPDEKSQEIRTAFIEQALRSVWNEAIEEAAKIVDDEIGDESDKDDDRGHLQSMHLGAMDALRTVFDDIRSLKKGEKAE